MNLIDKYIFREWVKAFLLALGAIVMVILLGIVYDDLRHFIEKGGSFYDISLYFISIIPGFLPIALPVALLISLLFVLGQMHRNGEIISMRAAGLSYWTITRSLWVSGFFLMLVLLILSTKVIPFSVEQAKGIEQKIKFQHEADGENDDAIGLLRWLAFDNTKDQRLWYVGSLSEYTKKAFGVNIYQRDAAGHEKSRVIAEEGQFDREKNAWIFRKGREIIFDKEGEPVQSKYFDEKVFEDYHENPDLMVLLGKKPRHLSFFQVRSIVKGLDYKENHLIAKYAVKYHSMLASALSCLIVVGVAIPFAISGVRLNPLVGVSKAIGLFFAYYLLDNVFGILGNQLVLSPWMAAWLPSVFMIILAMGLYRRMIYN